MTVLSYLSLALSLSMLTNPAGAYVRGPSAAPATTASYRDASYPQKLDVARALYYEDLEGKRGTDDEAQQHFTELLAQHPEDPVLIAYAGSLQLLESARTWAVWRKHELADEGLAKMDKAVSIAPENLEARFVRALTTWHLPFFFHRKEQAEGDLAIIGPRAEQAAARGDLPMPLAAAALDYWGQVLEERANTGAARNAWAAAVRVDAASLGGKDAEKRLKQ